MDASAAKHRWYHPTPAWLVWGAAVATGVLFACERWLKGWTVLLAVAVVAVVLLIVVERTLLALVFRERIPWGLQTLFVFATLCAVVCGWMSVRIKQAWRQADTVAAAQKKLHALVCYRWKDGGNHMPRSDALEKLLGIPFFADVAWLDVYGAQATDPEVADFAAKAGLEELWLEEYDVTDSTLTRLEGLTNLHILRLQRTAVTQEGVRKLQRSLPNCKIDVEPPSR
jgi:hypothetical protein